MSGVTVVGSGPSGVHFALSLLRKGIPVHMIDAGRDGARPPAPDADLPALRETLDDPVAYFLGEDLYGLALPGAPGEFYGFPPAKRFVFEPPPDLPERGEGFEPLGSWARGGLARAWTAGVYPFNEAELEAFPFGWSAIEPFYAEVAARIGVTGQRDDLARFMPWHEGVNAPLDLDPASRALIDRYGRVRDRLRRHGCYIGRSRVAVLGAPRDGRGACAYLGRCLWGCPVDALYTPDLTLDECRRYDHFRYEGGTLATGFRFDDTRRVRALRVRPLDGGPERELPVDRLALAAGTLSTARLFLASWLEGTGRPAELGGLMDNRQILVPFVRPALIGRRYEPRSYQYHQLSLGLESEPAREYVHGQITTLTTAQAHPILSTMPIDARTAAFVFRNARAALGLVNLNFHDSRRETCSVALDATGRPDEPPVLRTRYEPADDEPERIRSALARVRKGLRALGCLVAPGATHVRPMGASVHYAGTLPMSEQPRPFTVTKECRSHDFENLFVVDGSTFPFLPAKNITFTLMANAVRIAEEAF